MAIAGVYYTDYEPLKRAVSDVNGDGKINIVDDWHVNSVIDGMKSMSWVQDVVQKQTEAIGDGVQPYDPNIRSSVSNHFNNSTKLVNISTFGPLRAAYFVKEGPFCTYLFVPQTKESNENGTASNRQPISHIDRVIIQHDTFPSVPIPPTFFSQYTVTDVSRDQLLALAYTSYDLDSFNIQLPDDSVIKLVIFNMFLRENRFVEIQQYVHSMSESIDPIRTLLLPVMIQYDFSTDTKYDTPSAYLTVASKDNSVSWHIHIPSELKTDKFVNYYISKNYFV
ncbi:MAG: hypothetical protein EZS28_046476 [Streblomastix strix]|uniref:Uncharacterized protein n=1 Tax=Streblomastix strix TaxID=222440 RepID=A0A5J4TIB7_9EUKA|nr:MAG: hypothetical protein EZS28_046476 [Streblomastix strix]